MCETIHQVGPVAVRVSETENEFGTPYLVEVQGSGETWNAYSGAENENQISEILARIEVIIGADSSARR